ncbi:MAG: DNA adenine methylase [Magnetovibrionaceae bacterium]
MPIKLTPEPVTPAKPLAPWIGGKALLAKAITARIETISHTLYAEPFVGMGGVFFRRKTRPKAEMINDRNDEIVNLFRIVQRHPDAFTAALQYQLGARADFDRLKATPPEILTDIERAVRFLVIQRLAFGGRPSNPTFGTTTDRPSRFDPDKVMRLIETARARLAAVTIECLDWRDVLGRYDRPHTLFYLDPPYWNSEAVYGKGLFSRSDFAEMADLLARLKGAFILSLNDLPEVRETFQAFHIEEVETRYSCSRVKTDGRAPELLITNRKRA